jgi:LytS/YehU family sensor histidine kinase
MPHFIDIFEPHYKKLLASCERQKISVNLDIQDLTVNIRDASPVDSFLESEIRRALRNCKAGDKITLAEASNSQNIKISIKNSGRATLTDSEKAALREQGYEVRARFGYDTVVSINISR